MLYLSLTLLTVLVSPTLAFFSFQERIPNGNTVQHPCKANYLWQRVGHENPLGGGARNAFGKDFHDIGGNQWTPRLCRMDSDGDGRTNGEELGDPDCTWTPGRTPSRLTDITHPGICDPFNQGICAGRDTFVDCQEVTFEECDIINEQDVRSQVLQFAETSIPPKETNYYCMTFDLPSDQDYHMVAYEAMIDNRDVMHHMVLYGCDDKAERINQPQSCSMSENSCFNIIGLWTVGLAGKCIGDTVGFLIGKSSYTRVRLEYHYNNPKLVQDYTDSSALKIYYRPVRPEVKNLVTFMVGQRLLEIPPGQREVKIVGSCTGACTYSLFTEPVYVTEAINHMHYMGRSMSVEVYRNGRWLLNLTHDERYNYDTPIIHTHTPHIQLLPGDEIRTTCVYNSLSKDRWIYYGDGTFDEMCFAFIFMYPSDHTPYTTSCVAFGPLDPCAQYSGQPIGQCQWKDFLNTSHPDHTSLAEPLEKNCNLNGFCRPECKETVEQIQDHPCLTGEAGKFVKDRLEDENHGVEFLGRLHSCNGHDGHFPTPDPQDCRDQCHEYCYPDDGTGTNGASRGYGVTALVTMLGTLLFARLSWTE